MSKLTFQLQHTDKATEARAGIITTDHGQIETPIFMPVGTVGSVKAVHVDELKDDIKAQIILGNTYHLYLRPGLEILEQAGGLHKFNGFFFLYGNGFINEHRNTAFDVGLCIFIVIVAMPCNVNNAVNLANEFIVSFHNFNAEFFV